VPTATATASTDLQAIEGRARRDFVYTCETLLRILPKTGAIMPLRLNWPQRYIAMQYLIPAHQRGLPLALSILKARREGVSTLVNAWSYHKVRWYRGRHAMVYANDEDTLAELFGMVSRFHDYLPEAMQLRTSANNTKELEYADLDSRIGKRVAGHKDVGRGKTIHHAHLSEVDFYENPVAVMAGVVEAVPTQGPSSLILETTANGDGGFFHEHWLELKRHRGRMFSDRSWFPVFLPWFWHPDHQTEPPAWWEPTVEEAARMAAYRLSRAQAFWHHHKGQELETLNPGRGKKLLAQEYPYNDAECFIQSGECIFTAEGMEAIKPHRAPPVLGFTLVRVSDKQFRLEAHPTPNEAPVQVWEPPQPGYQYALGVDVSHGIGKDDSAVAVLRMPGFKLVAEWYDNFTSPRQLAYVVAAIAEYYASEKPADLPYVNIEINNQGLLTNETVMEMAMDGRNFQPYIWEMAFDRVAPPKVTAASRTGWLTTTVSKNILIGVANVLLGDQLVHIPSTSLQHEMARTIEVRSGVAQTKGADQVMAWMLALVVCYRKIARWAWPGMGMARRSADTEEQGPQRLANRATQDVRAEELLNGGRPRPAWDELPPGDGQGHWLVA
jgi:hypothetical protein